MAHYWLEVAASGGEAWPGGGSRFSAAGYQNALTGNGQSAPDRCFGEQLYQPALPVRPMLLYG
jgi:hypothetical protein